ncbi:MAG: hypothetical protein ABFD10_13445 [Prolixibacteraceae bacterium]
MQRSFNTHILFLVLSLLICTQNTVFAQNTRRWAFTGDEGIRWQVKRGEGHLDHIEMSGLRISGIIRYGVNEDGELVVSKKLVFPMLRTIPNNTHASLTFEFNDQARLSIQANGAEVKEYPESFELKGKLVVNSSTNAGLEIRRILFPSVDKAAFIEIVSLKNAGSTACKIRIDDNYEAINTDPFKGVYGQYVVTAATVVGGEVRSIPEQILAAGENCEFAVVYSGRKACEEPYSWSPSFELDKREDFIADVFACLQLDTPNDTIDREFAFAKIRATESIYDTKGGLMHGPGGGAYYAAVWANDQAEYANPFFPFEGILQANESAINSFRLFARYMNKEYKPIPSSIIAEGTDYWNGAGDRGDMAMIAYGASRFALAYGRERTASELWPLISWCMEYLEHKKTSEGVIASDNDELEGRFPAGKINLSTNSLAYGACISAAHLAESLGMGTIASTYRKEAAALKVAIEKYFGATIQGFDTYRYSADNTKLRSWICLPLVMGITDRKEQTIDALFSDHLWTANGILTESGSKTFWDRSTLYAFRGLLASGATDKCMGYLGYYSAMRLLGEHVPYPVEAWPEGDQRHLSAESALYCRVITEGLFGIEPTGLNAFTMTPRLPKGWDYMNLRNIKAFNRTFAIEVVRNGKQEVVTVKTDKGKTFRIKWDGKAPVPVVLDED